MKVFVVGGGAREHALCRSLSLDPVVDALVCAPGNAGTAEIAEPYALDVSDPIAIAELAERCRADLTVVGPELPLVAGAADELAARGLPVFGPSAAAARIEGSKAYAKKVMTAAGVPTAAARAHTVVEAALADLDEFGPPYVIKADGLAAGKGVTVTEDREAAVAAVRGCLHVRGRPGRDRGVPRRPRGVAVRGRDHGRSRSCRCSGPGRQAGRRRRHRAEHRRDGCLLPAAVGTDATWSSRSWTPCCARRSPRWPGRARRTPACCTPAWH